MNRKLWFGILSSVLLAGCGSNTPTPAFVTATLFPTNISLPVSTQIPAPTQVVAVTIQPVEGVTTTQLNVRSEPSTAGESLNVIAAFSKVQIVGKESNGKWYQILDAASSNEKGWIIASYVQVNATAEIPVVEIGAGAGSGASGLVIQGVNVRNGAGKDFASLGTLIPNDVIPVTGRDSSGAWLQISFKGSAGWVASEFIEVKNAESLPVIANQVADTPAPAKPTPAVSNNDQVLQDNDSLEAPVAEGILGSAEASQLQFKGFLSPQNGDNEDWIQFSASNESTAVEISCFGDTLKLDLFKNKQPVVENFLNCKESKILNIEPDQIYTIKLTQNAATPKNTPYSVSIKIVK